jgi:cytochrome b involved in lipid metabolism
MASPSLIQTGPDSVQTGPDQALTGLDQTLAGVSLDQSLDRSESSDSDPSTQYTVEEVAKHHTEGDQWIIFRDRVYDVSSFKHPGGPEAIQRNSGTDATQKILAVKAHLKKLDRIVLMLSEYEIGRIVDQSKRNLNT